MEQVRFKNRRGQKLAGLLEGKIGPTMVLFCHGMLSDKSGAKHESLAALLAEKNIATLRFDFAGRGGSEGSLYDLTISNQMEDLDAAIEYAVQRGAERVALFGSSLGGTTALLQAARDERVIAIATLAAIGRLPEFSQLHAEETKSFVERGFLETVDGKIGRGFLDDAQTHDVLSAVGILRIPLLVVHGDADTVVSPTDAEDIATAASNVCLEMVNGADHTFSSPHYLRPALRSIALFLSSAIIADSSSNKVK